jgi:hypothetical protein
LDAPGPNNDNIAYTEPHSSFHLAWNSTHAGFSILRSNGDSAAAEHLFDRSKDFILVFSGQSHLAWLFFNQLNTSIDISFRGLSVSQVDARLYILRVGANFFVRFHPVA